MTGFAERTVYTAHGAAVLLDETGTYRLRAADGRLLGTCEPGADGTSSVAGRWLDDALVAAISHARTPTPLVSRRPSALPADEDQAHAAAHRIERGGR